VKQLHFLKHGRGQLYVADQGNYRYQVYRTSRQASQAVPRPAEVWAASVHPRNSKKPVCLDHTFTNSKAEAIDWCSKWREPEREKAG
jgi:hypothetical protein